LAYVAELSFVPLSSTRVKSLSAVARSTAAFTVNDFSLITICPSTTKTWGVIDTAPAPPGAGSASVAETFSERVFFSPDPPGLPTSASARESSPSRAAPPTGDNPSVPSPPSALGPDDGRWGSSLSRRFASFARFSAARSSRDFCRMMSRMLFARESSTAASAPAAAVARCEPGCTRFPRVVLAERTQRCAGGAAAAAEAARAAGTEGGGGIAARASRSRASLSLAAFVRASGTTTESARRREAPAAASAAD
jgi:hypothetical protein